MPDSPCPVTIYSSTGPVPGGEGWLVDFPSPVIEPATPGGTFALFSPWPEALLPGIQFSINIPEGISARGRKVASRWVKPEQIEVYHGAPDTQNVALVSFARQPTPATTFVWFDNPRVISGRLKKKDDLVGVLTDGKSNTPDVKETNPFSAALAPALAGTVTRAPGSTSAAVPPKSRLGAPPITAHHLATAFGGGGSLFCRLIRAD